MKTILSPLHMAHINSDRDPLGSHCLSEMYNLYAFRELHIPAAHDVHPQGEISRSLSPNKVSTLFPVH